MKRSVAIAGLMVLAAASSAAAQSRPSIAERLSSQATTQTSATQGRAAITEYLRGRAATPASSSQTVACPEGAYSVVQSPDGSSVSVLFNDFQLSSEEGGPATQRAVCRIQVPLAIPAGYGAGLTSVDYRGFALLGQRQSADLSVDYEVGRGNRGPRFQRHLQGQYEGDFAFTDRLPPGRVRQAGCGAVRGGPTTLVIDAALTLDSRAGPDPAMVSLDSADQASRALTYRFEVRPCPRGQGRLQAY